MSETFEITKITHTQYNKIISIVDAKFEEIHKDIEHLMNVKYHTITNLTGRPIWNYSNEHKVNIKPDYTLELSENKRGVIKNVALITIKDIGFLDPEVSVAYKNSDVYNTLKKLIRINIVVQFEELDKIIESAVKNHKEKISEIFNGPEIDIHITVNHKNAVHWMDGHKN